jgi:hypothetical protein
MLSDGEEWPSIQSSRLDNRLYEVEKEKIMATKVFAVEVCMEKIEMLSII